MNDKMEKEIFEISVDDVLPNRFQPRISFDQNSLNELADSIRQHGIIQPLVVRKLGDKYEIIAGERRYKAAVLVGLKTVPAIIMNLDDNQSAEIAIVENIQRKEMTPLEEAKSYKKLLDKGYLTQEQLAARMGKSQPAIANKLRLLNLSEVVQDALLHEKISERHARSLLAVKTPKDQSDILNEILNKKLTVRQTDDLIKQRFGVTEDEVEGMPGGVSKLEIYSNPTPIIPNPYASNEPNPQLNLINRLNGVENNNPLPQAEKPSNPVPLAALSSQPPTQSNAAINGMPYIDINNVPKEPTENVSQPISLDINKVKEEAKDINQEVVPVNINELLNPREETPPQVDPQPEEPKNRFIFDFDDEKKDETSTNVTANVPNNMPLSTSSTSNIINIPHANQIEDYDILDISEPQKAPALAPIATNNSEKAIELIKNNIETLKSNGIKVSTEEFDFEKLYQIIIKIDK